MSSSSTGSTAPSDTASFNTISSASHDSRLAHGSQPGHDNRLSAASLSNAAHAANAIQPAPACSLTLSDGDSGSAAGPFCSLPLNLHQGDTIRLPDDGSIRLPRTSANEDSLYQVIALDAGHDRCWIRSWPLTRQGAPVFEISLQQAQRHGAQRPVLQRHAP